MRIRCCCASSSWKLKRNFILSWTQIIKSASAKISSANACSNPVASISCKYSFVISIFYNISTDLCIVNVLLFWDVRSRKQILQLIVHSFVCYKFFSVHSFIVQIKIFLLSHRIRLFCRYSVILLIHAHSFLNIYHFLYK